MRHQSSERLAVAAAATLRRRLRIRASAQPQVAVVLGTGWGEALPWKRPPAELPFAAIDGFADLGVLPGHERKVLFGHVGSKRVIAMQGRVHLNEDPADPRIPRMVRLQVEMLLQLGVKNLILTAAAGSIRYDIRVGDIMVVGGLITLFAPAMPLFVGEFCSPEDTLDPDLQSLAVEAIKRVNDTAPVGGYAMVRGPHFEGRRYDKSILGLCGAATVGMSILPEACVAALYPGTRVLALNFVTNSSHEVHSHDTNQARARERAGSMGAVLRRVITKL